MIKRIITLAFALCPFFPSFPIDVDIALRNDTDVQAAIRNINQAGITDPNANLRISLRIRNADPAQGTGLLQTLFNGISDSTKEKIFELYLNNNQLTMLPNLTNLTNLSFLDLSNNQLTMLPNLTNLTNLSFLHLEDNRLTALPALMGLNNLQALHLANNPLVEPLRIPNSLRNLRVIGVAANLIHYVEELLIDNLDDLQLAVTQTLSAIYPNAPFPENLIQAVVDNANQERLADVNKTILKRRVQVIINQEVARRSAEATRACLKSLNAAAAQPVLPKNFVPVEVPMNGDYSLPVFFSQGSLNALRELQSYGSLTPQLKRAKAGEATLSPDKTRNIIPAWRFWNHKGLDLETFLHKLDDRDLISQESFLLPCGIAWLFASKLEINAENFVAFMEKLERPNFIKAHDFVEFVKEQTQKLTAKALAQPAASTSSSQ